MVDDTTTSTDEVDDGTATGDDGRTFSQADVDRLVRERLGRERSKYADYDDLKTKASEYDRLVESQKSEQQKLAEQLAAAEAREKQATVQLLRSKVAAAKGLTPALAARLRGETEEEITADADDLLAELKTDRKPDLKQGDRGDKPAADGNEWMRRLGAARHT